MKGGSNRLIGVIALWSALSFLAIGANAKAQPLDAVPWTGLETRVLELGILEPIEDLGVSECPAHYAENEPPPHRLVLQWIENTFYKWKEYDLADGRICVLMVLPDPALLTREETQVLLSASRLWQTHAQPRSEADLAPVDPADPTLHLPPAPERRIDPSAPDMESQSGSDALEHRGVTSPSNPDGSSVPPVYRPGLELEPTPESVIDTDDRDRVFDTTAYPWNTISYVTYNQAGRSFRATAFLVSPFAALTNGHVVYDQFSRTWSTNMVIYPGQYEAGSKVYRPFGSVAAYQLGTSAGYTGGSGDPQYDYATIRYTTPFSGITTYMPVVFSGFNIDNETTRLSLAGYPGEARGTGTLDQWFHESNSSAQTTTTIARYYMDSSGGNSGGPVWLPSGGNRYVVAIHCCGWGNPQPNGGPLMGSHNQGAIEGWLAWTPRPGAATPISPAGTVGDNSPTYTWRAVQGSTRYYLWVDDTTSGGSGKIKTWYTAAEAGCASGGGTCSVRPATPLANGSAEWWIQTWNNAGEGPWSASMPFTVRAGSTPGPATLLNPAGTIADNRPTYTWRAVRGSTWYYLWVDDATSGGSGKIKTWYTAAQAGCASGSGTCSVRPATPLANGSAEWWIQTWNDAGEGPWSSAKAFRVNAAPPRAATLLGPGGTIGDTRPTYSWRAVRGSTWYYLWVDDTTSGGSGKIKTWYTAAQAGCASGSGTCSVRPATPLANGSAEWWIQTWNDAGEGPWSAGKRFRIAAGR
jgi:V8-like Glu-specific endopeptidase